MNDRAHSGDQDHHDGAQPIDIEAEAEPILGCRQSRKHGNTDRAPRADGIERPDGDKTRQGHGGNADLRAVFSQLPSECADDDSSGQRQQRNEKHDIWSHECASAG